MMVFSDLWERKTKTGLREQALEQESLGSFINWVVLTCEPQFPYLSSGAVLTVTML